LENNSTTRLQLTEAVHNEIGLSRYESSKFVEQVLELISSALIQNEQVKISKFGTFSTRNKVARVGRNPKTGIEAEISERRVITFRASNNMKQSINKDSRL
jgi:integration host factor subunit alpha